MAGSLIPPLRPTVRLTLLPPGDGPEEGPVAVLVDEELGQRLELDPPGLNLARRLTVAQPFDPIARELDGGAPELARRVAQLVRHALLDTPEARRGVEQARITASWDTRPVAEIPLLVRPEARFSCIACGSCCGCQSIGPVSDEVLQATWAHRTLLPPEVAGDQGLFCAVSAPQRPDRPARVICQLRDGFCVFLAADGLCELHRRWGPEAKPACCNTFPFLFVATPRGVAVSLQLECRSHDRSRQGTPVTEQVDLLRALLPGIPRLRRVPPVLFLDAVRGCTWEEYEALEERLHQEVAGPGDDLAILLGLHAALEARRDVDRVPPTAPGDRAGLRQDLDRLVAELLAGLSRLADRFQPLGERTEVHTESLELLAGALRNLRAGMRRLATPLPPGELGELARDFFHNRLMAKRLTDAPTLVHGLGRLAFSWLLVRALLWQRIRQVKRRHPLPQDLVDSMVIVAFLLHDRDFVAELARHDALLVSLFHDRLPALLQLAPELPDAQTKAQIYKF